MPGENEPARWRKPKPSHPASGESDAISDIQFTPLPAAQIALFGNPAKYWGWLLAVGSLSTAVGTVGLGASFGLTLVAVTFFGWMLLVVGIGRCLRVRGLDRVSWGMC